MGRNVHRRISYVLPLASSAAGHRLGVNGLAIDANNSVLYSGGRDGVICAWNLNLDLRPEPWRRDYVLPTEDDSAPPARRPATELCQQVQAHTHWINDITLAQNNEALVSASSDISVKLWRPAAHGSAPPQTIGLHSDYVKCLASPGPTACWVASGGLDGRINLWDLNGVGRRLQIAVGDDERSAKGSVYALAATNSLLASGGPESIIRIWDPRSSKRITKLVGHTDNVRDILIADEGDTIMTASSDQTVKVWSMTAGRCMYTLSMHNDSVWSLYSDHPQLSVFYSSDRSGLVAKTDVRGFPEMDRGMCVALCQEHEGVSKLVVAGDCIWTATCSSSINRWQDVNIQADTGSPESKDHHRVSSSTTRTRFTSSTCHTYPSMATVSQLEGIPKSAFLRLSNTTSFHLTRDREHESATLRLPVALINPSDPLGFEVKASTPIRGLPDFSIEGQNGLIKHFLLNDRRRVLTLDTAGEVMLWDLLQCRPIKSFGKRHLEDVAPEVNTTETVAHWCAVDTRTGGLTCVLEENHCFDGEMYADELPFQNEIQFREDQRINLGKWVLRYLFANLIDEEINRDEVFRQQLLLDGRRLRDPPYFIDIPELYMNGWKEGTVSLSATTLRASNGIHMPIATPGSGIGIVTPATYAHGHAQYASKPLPPTVEEGSRVQQTTSGGPVEDASDDYFFTGAHSQAALASSASSQTRKSNEEPRSPMETEKREGAAFGRKFKMSFGGTKKPGRPPMPDSSSKPLVETAAETPDESDSRTSKSEDGAVEDSLVDVIQVIRLGYEDQVQQGVSTLVSAIEPSTALETPVLKPPLGTSILIQEDRPGSGGVSDLFEGTVASLGQQADLIERVAPRWLGEALLRNNIPYKVVKISFVLEPYRNLLPAIASDGNNRLNANRMLRARKIIAYTAERIEALAEHTLPNALKPEEYLELYCNDQLVSPTMTLATIRTHIWRGGGDVVLYYKSNGRKEIRPVWSVPPILPVPPKGSPPPSAIPGSLGTMSTDLGGSTMSAWTSREDEAVPGSVRAVPP